MLWTKNIELQRFYSAPTAGFPPALYAMQIRLIDIKIESKQLRRPIYARGGIGRGVPE